MRSGKFRHRIFCGSGRAVGLQSKMPNAHEWMLWTKWSQISWRSQTSLKAIWHIYGVYGALMTSHKATQRAISSAQGADLED
jgi:hypothetical protein